MTGRPFDCGDFDEYKHCEMTQELAKILWTYYPEIGEFRWNKKPRYQTEAGDLAGCISSGRHMGYRIIRFAGRGYKASRLAVLYMTGKWPLKVVDHINNDRADDRWENIRQATQTLNHGNRRKASNNTSGYKGVSRSAKDGKFYAYIQFNKKSRNLGGYSTAEEAKAVYDREARIIFGEFANAG
jgi:hypothetical protein